MQAVGYDRGVPSCVWEIATLCDPRVVGEARLLCRIHKVTPPSTRPTEFSPECIDPDGPQVMLLGRTHLHG